MNKQISKAFSAKELTDRIYAAIEIATRYGGIQETHHMAWVIDQMVRTLAEGDYDLVVADACSGEDGPNTYDWDVGTPP